MKRAEPSAAEESTPGSRPEASGSQVVSASDLERQLDLLRSRVEDPREGVFGPQSKLWEVGRHAMLFLGSGRAALLQIAHPYVAHAIDQHSATKEDPLGRFYRTFYNVFAMVYGDLDVACEAARRVHAVHTGITGRIREPAGAYVEGSPYRANEKHALLWVHATLWDTSVLVFEKIVRPLTVEEKEEYYLETKRFAYLFGVDNAVLPESWTEFELYNRTMWESDELSVGRPAAEIASFLFEPLHPTLAPVAKWFRIVTAGLLPEPVREGFGLPFGPREERVLDRSLRLLRRCERHLPQRLRYVPAYIEAQRRLAGRRGRDRLGEFLTRLYLGKPPSPSTHP